MLYQGHYHPGINAIAGLRFAKSTTEWKAKTLRRSGGRNKAGGLWGVLISWHPLRRKRDGGKRGKTGNTERGLPAFAATTRSCRRERAQGLVVLHGAVTLGVTRGGGTGRYTGWWPWGPTPWWPRQAKAGLEQLPLVFGLEWVCTGSQQKLKTALKGKP